MSEWTSVEDKTPEVDESVLILYSDGTMYVGHITFYPAWVYRKEPKYRWSDNFTGCCSGQLFPTHWRPLPDPPVQMALGKP